MRKKIAGPESRIIKGIELKKSTQPLSYFQYERKPFSFLARTDLVMNSAVKIKSKIKPVIINIFLAFTLHCW
jgi:hypothetical protein